MWRIWRLHVPQSFRLVGRIQPRLQAGDFRPCCLLGTARYEMLAQGPLENAYATKTSHFLFPRVQFSVDTVEDICKIPVVNALRSAFALL